MHNNILSKLFNHNYSQYGGEINEKIIWPPVVGKIIMIKKPNDQKTFIGKVNQNIWNNTASIILLMNNKDYVENINISSQLPNPLPDPTVYSGQFVLFPTYYWKYINDNEFVKITSSTLNSQNVSDAYEKVLGQNDVLFNLTGGTADLFDLTGGTADLFDLTGGTADLQTCSLPNMKTVDFRSAEPIKSQLKETVVKKYANMMHIPKPKTQFDLINEFYEDASNQHDYSDKKSTQQQKDLNTLFPFDPNTMFDEQNINNIMQPQIIITDRADLFTEVKEVGTEYLKGDIGTDYAERSKIKTVVTSFAIDYLMKKEGDVEREGSNIINWLFRQTGGAQDYMINEINQYFIRIKKTDGIFSHDKIDAQVRLMFSNLDAKVFNGYVHIIRKDTRVIDDITPELVPGLKHLAWQYSKSIDYDTLKFILFQNQYQHSLKKDKELQSEAEKVLSQEFLIAVQPLPKYQLWVLLRIILAWFSNEEVSKNLRKIKVLINQWRCKSDEPLNIRHGVLPSIVLYPKYGTTPARTISKEISDCLSLVPGFGWTLSTPTYFVKQNNLVWVTNGSMDLKLYFRNTMRDSNKSIHNKSLNDKFTWFNAANNFLRTKKSI